MAGIYGIREAVVQNFHRSPDFGLKEIRLNANDVLDEGDLVKSLGIDLSSNIFDFDIETFERELVKMPAIQSAKVDRNLPGTLVFNISTRKPMAWIACPDKGLPAARTAGSLLVDHDNFLYPCPPGQVEVTQSLPIIELSPNSAHPIHPGTSLEHPEYKYCLKLLKAIVARHHDGLQTVDTISQTNRWSLAMKTRSGTVATFGLGDHKRQLDYLIRAFDQSHKKGYQIETINLIPKRNVPITVSADDTPPRAIPVREETVAGTGVDQRAEDLRNLLNRN